MSEPARDPKRLRIFGLTETCGNCVVLQAEIDKKDEEIARLTKAIQRDSHVMDAADPHRRRV